MPYEPTTTTPHPHRWAALAVLLLAEAMNLLDATVMTVAAPVIRADLGGSDAAIQWFSAAYTLPFAVFLITGGRLGDIAGRRRVFRAGMAAFTLASPACALAPSTGALIAVRAVQGAAAALIIPQTIGMIRALFDGRELARAMGSVGPVMGLAAVTGPALGGVLTHADLFGSTWRAVFLVNVPLGAAVLLASPLLREDRAARRPRLDLTGTVLAVLGTGLVVHPLIQGGALGWPGWCRALPVVGCALLACFALHQRWRGRRGRSPLVEPSLFRGIGFPAALMASVLFFAAVNGLMLVIAVELQVGLHSDVLTAGFTLLPWSVAMALSSWAAGAWLVPRYGARVMSVGLLALLAGTVAAAVVYGTGRPGSYPWPLLPALAVAGLGQGLYAVPFFTTALHHVRPHETGSAAGLLNAVQQLGGTLGVALLGSVFFHTAASGAHGSAALTGARNAFCVAAVLVLATAAATAFIGPRQQRSSTPAGLRPGVAGRTDRLDGQG
ncbi:MFS transporter [Streptomyces spinoverrucosus]|uniref:MFS transporter n=1 Tax=Streptomyces spinoverrucosus TaxID=284043 RepID=A0A4Y3VGZ1_9ACTN|nr:MFS transporter [Streptomyces spinoverrucosus]GEC06194.1 MFS transporter [Streptomyces spinoverrucosus]GHB75290.1 MFS transporter [Streptomyces spinoverrucosus]